MNSGLNLYVRLLGYVRPYWRQFALAIAAMVATAATEPLFPALMKPLLDGSFAGRSDTPIWYFPAAIIGIFVGRGCFSFLAGYGVQWVAHRVVMDVRDEAFARVVFLPATFYEKHSSGRIISRIAYDVGGVAGAATGALTVVVRDSMTVIGLLAWMMYLNWQLSLVSLLIFPPVAFLVSRFSKRLRRVAHGVQTSTGGLVALLGEAIRGHKIVKIFGGQRYEIDRFKRISQSLRGLNMRMVVATELQTPMVQFFAALAVATVVTAALYQAAEARTTVGGFVSFLTAMLMLLAPIKRLSDVNATLQRGIAAAESLFSLLDEMPEADTGTVRIERARGGIRFEGAGVRYEGAERDALSEVNLEISPGQTIALIGPSGGGKTTMVNLLPRFYPLARGRILLDDHDIQSLRLSDLRANIALVSQDVMLFNDTVAANIAYGASGPVDPSALEEAARAAHALEFIDQLPQRFDTQIGENGVRLSGGQRQRLAIARAILKNAPVLILDEATSALDSESERQVQAALDELMQGRTTLVIAHRLSTIEHADLIVVLQNGRIVERGTHAELLRRAGVYAQLHAIQFADRESAKA